MSRAHDSRARRTLAIALLAVVSLATAPQEQVLAPREGSLRFAVIGDSGTGGGAQRQIGEQLVKVRERFPFTFVLMLGDNLYGGESLRDYQRKFERPYKPLLDAGVKFYASLGNHDDPNQAFYTPFNMDGKRYYSFKPSGHDVRFFALDTTYMVPAQLSWAESELEGSDEEWKICFFHHPLYSTGARHGSDLELRRVLEPLFVEHGVSVVFSGHEHFYQRLRPQRGIHYFISGAAGKLRRGNIRPSKLSAKGFDNDYSFMLVEIEGRELRFQSISRAGQVVDSGTIRRREETAGRQPLARAG